MERNYKRVILSDDEIIKEGQLLREKGIDHVLVLTGEAQKQVGSDFIQNAVKLLHPHFSSVGIEVQPLTVNEYKNQIQSGADQLTIYQETYHPEYYKKYHLKGNKSNYSYRLDTPDRGGEAGFFKMNLGVLLGLYDWRYEAIALAYHVHYLQQHYWKSKLAVSFPRIKNMGSSFHVPFEVDDKTLVKLICMFRLMFPDIGITLSTREPAALRNQLIALGITTISAESKTEPGGYSGKEAHGQFEISDERSVLEMKHVVSELGYDPVMKDWDHSYIN
jgi:2-iminoacetate synthase